MQKFHKNKTITNKTKIKAAMISLAFFPFILSTPQTDINKTSKKLDSNRQIVQIQKERPVPMINRDSLQSIDTKILDFGESHKVARCKEIFLEIMPKLDSMGYKKIFLELISEGYDYEIAQFLKTSKMPYSLLQDVYLSAKNTGEQGASIHDNSLKKIMEKACELGWEIEGGYHIDVTDRANYLISSDSVYTTKLLNEQKTIFYGGQLHHIQAENVAHIDIMTKSIVMKVAESRDEFYEYALQNKEMFDRLIPYIYRQEDIVEALLDMPYGFYRIEGAGQLENYYILFTK
jgi:hypothetical protein